MWRRSTPFAAILLLCPGAHAQSAADACVSTYEGAQQRMRDGQLRRSREELLLCEAKCIRSLAADCRKWRAQVEREIPSLEISAKEADGSDPGQVRVFIDGRVLAESLGGGALEVDPGKHSLTFEGRSGQRVVVSVDVPRGSKEFAVDVRFPPFSAPSPPSPPPSPPRARVFAPLVLGAVGLAAAGTGLALGILGHEARRHLINTCAPYCLQADVDAIARDWTIGGVLGATGGAAAIAATLWWSLDEGKRSAAPAMTLLPGPGSLSLTGTF